MPDRDKLDLSMFLDDYLNDAKEGFQEINRALLALEKDHDQRDRLDEIFRVFHTLKSSSTMLELSQIADLAHISEDLLDRLRSNDLPITQDTIDLLFEVVDTLEAMVKAQSEENAEEVDFQAVGKRVEELVTEGAAGVKVENDKGRTVVLPSIEKVQTIRVHVDLLDSMFDLVGELIIAKNRIDNIVSDTGTKELTTTLAAMGRMISDLQENVSLARMVPVDEVFRKFPRMVRDLAREQGKEIELVLEGRDIELDKAILDAISEPLIHLLRNGVDHGIELPEDREKHGKARLGTIKLVAKRAENHISIEVEDDGAGIDAERVKDVAVRKGFGTAEEIEALDEKGVLNLLFSSGFSSADQVTGLSGRGVGLHVVRTAARELGGRVEVASQIGQGSRFTLRLPLSTAIMQTLMVSAGENVFAIPSEIVLETLEIKPEYLRGIRNDQVLVLREQAIPFHMLESVLNLPHHGEEEGLIGVILSQGDDLICLGVDMVLSQMETIVKPFDPIAQEFKGFSGGTILGDGRVALLLDVPTLFDFELRGEEKYAA